MPPYRKGAHFEREVRRYLQERGFFCWRIAGSKGEGHVDLIAYGPVGLTVGAVEVLPFLFIGSRPGWWLIQCKKNKKITDDERQAIRETAQRCDALPMLAFRSFGKIYFSEMGPSEGEK